MSGKIIIVDLDGTLCEGGERIIFFLTKPKNYRAANAGVIHDEQIQHTKYILDLLHANRDIIIVLTAREETCKKETLQWLDTNKIPYTDIYMRKNGDNRKDFIVKKELLKEIEKKYGKPFLAFEDRPDVIEMLKLEGVLVFQV